MRNHIQLADAYYRLSDEERKYGESASITNQRTIVREYCEASSWWRSSWTMAFPAGTLSGRLPGYAGTPENWQGQHGYHQGPVPSGP